MDNLFVLLIFVLVLAIFLGFELINKVPSTLHTPLMSGANAISGITIVGALISSGSRWRFVDNDTRDSSGFLCNGECCRWLLSYKQNVRNV